MTKRMVTVIVDGNNHNIMRNGKKVVFETEIEGDMVTLKKGQEIAEKIRELGHEPKTLKVILSKWDDEGYEMGDDSKPMPRQTLNKTAFYNVDKNTLVIWQDGEPVYANANGTICRDRVALADSYYL